MEIAGLLVVAGVVLVAGIRIGMLVAPRITRWADRADEEPNDD
jgi:hypothetical protein